MAGFVTSPGFLVSTIRCVGRRDDRANTVGLSHVGGKPCPAPIGRDSGCSWGLLLGAILRHVVAGLTDLLPIPLAPGYRFSPSLATLLHGIINGSAGIVIVYAVTESPVFDELVASPVGAASVVVFAVMAIGNAVVGPPDLTPDVPASRLGRGIDRSRGPR